MFRISFALLAAVAACGGGSTETKPTPPPAPGETHAAAPGPAAPDVAGEPAPSPPPQPESVATRPPLPKPEGRVIELKNDGDGELAFGVTKGWQPVVFAYTGKPPKAKSIQLFESYCTASCAASDAEICPVCKEPKNKKEELAMVKTESAPAGGSVKVPWDGKIFVYDKAKGKHHCKCWSKADPPADSYTIRACGRRPATEPGKPSKPTCAETQVVLGPGDQTPQTITLSFK
jgi:hypothetical protein